MNMNDTKLDIEAKIKEDMRKLGCESNVKIVLAYNLYIHLVDEKLMYDTEYCYNKDIDTLYVVARPSKSEKLNIYVPIPTSNQISMDQVHRLQENLCTIETGPSINLAFIDGDCTTVIYSFTKGLVSVTSPEGVIRRRTREERRNFIDSELLKNRDAIKNDALHGEPVEENDCEIIE